MAEIKDYLTSLELFRDYPVGEKRFVYRFVKEPEVVEAMKPFRIAEIATKILKKGKIRAIDNRTGLETKNGFFCTQIGLFRIAVFPGNDLKYRKSYESFDKQLTIVPQSYIDRLRAVEDDLRGWKEKLVNASKITINDLEGIPEWSKRGDSCG